MHCFLWLVIFLNRYIPRLAELCVPLRKLILYDPHYILGLAEQPAFNAIQTEFQQKITLPFFDRNKETVLQTDASKIWWRNSTRRTTYLLCFTQVLFLQKRITRIPFQSGQNVRFQNSNSRQWEEAVIQEKCREPNSYIVKLSGTGGCFRGNSNFSQPGRAKRMRILQILSQLPMCQNKS